MGERKQRKMRLRMRVDARRASRSAAGDERGPERGETRHDSAGAILRFVRFTGSSLACTLLDQLLAGALFVLLRTPLRGFGFLRILIGSVVARCVSQTLNYVLNHHLVFAGGEAAPRPPRRESIPRFLAVASLVLALSTVGVYLLHAHLGLQESLAKIAMDSLLFFLNYYLQQNWVFSVEPTIDPRKIRRRRKQGRQEASRG